MPIGIPEPRSLARMFMDEMVTRGWTNRRIMDALRTTGLGYRDTEMRADIRENRGAEAIRKAYLSITPGSRPSPRLIIRTEKHLTTPFRAIFRMPFHDPLTGKTTFKFASLGLAKIRTKGALISQMSDILEPKAVESDVDLSQLTLIGIEGRTLAEYAWEPDDSPW